MCDRNTCKIPYMLFKKTNADGRELYTATSATCKTFYCTSSDDTIKILRRSIGNRFDAINEMRANAADPGWMDRELPQVISWHNRAGNCFAEILPRQFIEIDL